MASGVCEASGRLLGRNDVAFNNRKNPYLFRDTMLKLIHSENLEYKELTKAA
jgi:hypothetical protein